MAIWLEALTAAERAHQPAVLVTLLATKGSTPRNAGTKMVVTRDGIAGTIGGGNLEFQCEAAAHALLDAGATGPSTRAFPLGPALGQCCGGHVTVLFEVLRPPGLHIALFGAGHVGRALVRLLAGIPCRVSWIDPRADAFSDAVLDPVLAPALADTMPDRLPAHIRPVRSDHPAAFAAALPAGSLVLVMTHDHQLDFEIVAATLPRPDLLAVGLIGSATKRARFTSRLARLGIAADRLICPIGLPGITGKEPAVVAISVAAQILQLQQAEAQMQPGQMQPGQMQLGQTDGAPVMAGVETTTAQGCAACSRS